jgi:cytochrome c-type biogenesis protein CcmH
MKTRFTIAVIFGLLLMVFVSSVAFAQDPTPVTVTDDQVNAVAKQLYCPVCENIPLDVCPTQACAQWRDLIRLKLSQGWSADQIKEYFAEQYGERVLATPRPNTGFNWLLVPVPIAAFLAGAYILYRALKSLSKPSGAGATASVPPVAKASTDDEYVKRLEEELRKR